MKIEKLKTLGIAIITAAVVIASPAKMTYAADAVKAEPVKKEMKVKKVKKAMSCNSEAKKKGIKGKTEIKKYVASCNKARKAAKKKAAMKKMAAKKATEKK